MGIRLAHFEGFTSNRKQWTFIARLMLITLTSSLLTSQSPAASPFDEQIFEKQTSRWSVQCDPSVRYHGITDPTLLTTLSLLQISTADFQTQMLRYIRRTVLVGLHKLAPINSTLAERIYSQTREQKINFTCDQLPRGLTSVYRIESKTMNLDAIAHYLLSQGQIRHADMHKKNNAEQIVFHEFLHSVNLDNIPALYHGLPMSQRPKELANEYDLVYACTAQVYPTNSSKVMIKIVSKDAIYMNTQKACQTCAQGMLTNEGGKLRALTEDEKNRVCGHIKDEDFRFSFEPTLRNPQLEIRREDHLGMAPDERR